MTGYRRTAGGNWQVSWSVAPGVVVRRTIPVEQFNEATIATLGREVAAKHNRKEPQ